MPGQQEGTGPRTLSAEVEASLAAVWARFVGVRPTETSIQLDGNVIRLTLPDGTEQFDRGMAREDETPNARLRTPARYEREAARAVSKVTRRKVDAMISRHDAKTGIATEVFILEQLPKKY